jgi:hypothetical protein
MGLNVVHHVTNTVTFLHLYFGQGMSDDNCELVAQPTLGSARALGGIYIMELASLIGKS